MSCNICLTILEVLVSAKSIANNPSPELDLLSEPATYTNRQMQIFYFTLFTF